METVVADAQALSATKRPVNLNDIFDFSLVRKVDEDLKEWRP
jgi:hypothetical protein